MKKKKSVAYLLAGIALFVVALILMITAAFSKWKAAVSVGIIGGADGPTKIIVGKTVDEEKINNIKTENNTAETVETTTETVGTRIDEQSFEIELDDWGNVTFASYAPDANSYLPEGMNPDVRFYLMSGNMVLYEFPGWNEAHTNAALFLAVSAVSFQDYNDDGLKDVITLCEYETMSGEGFLTARVHFQLDGKQGFEEDTLLTEYLSKNHHTGSIASVMNAKESYWNYLSAMDGHRGIENQLQIIAENQKLWAGNPDFACDIYKYAVTDLDRNGRYEIMISNHGGTGLYTYTKFYEINETYDGLIECETNFREGDSQPDIILDEKLKTYTDDNGVIHYVVYDILKNGAAEYYENYSELTLTDNKITVNPIAYRTTLYNTQTVTCTDAFGNTISEEDFENTPDTFFDGYMETLTYLGWQDAAELVKNSEELLAKLKASVEANGN